MFSKIEKFHFDIVNGCQLRCVGCPNSGMHRKLKFVTAENFVACLDNVDVNDVKLLRLFNYGEPMLHPDVPGLLRLIPGRRFTPRAVEISTNAQHHDFDMLKEIFRTGVLTRLAVSCDGEGTAEDYERLRPPGKWDKLLAFLAKAGELRDAHAPQVALITRSICETEEGKRRWRDLLAPLGFEPEFRSWLVLPDSTQNPAGRKAQVANVVCGYMQMKTLYVDCEGTVVPCCVHPRAGVFGNLLEQRYSEIFRGERRREFIRKLKTDRGAMPICGKCEEQPRKRTLFKRLGWA